MQTSRQEFFKRNMPPALCTVAGLWCLLLAVGFFGWMFRTSDNFSLLMSGIASIMLFIFAVRSFSALGSRSKTEKLAERFSDLDLLALPIFLPAFLVVWLASIFQSNK